MRGHIRRRGRNSFEIKYEVPREGGGRRTVYRTVKGSRREAAAELNRLQAQVASGGHVDSSKLAVSGYLMTRLAHWKASGVISPKTAERYEQLITGQIIPHIGSKLIQKLTTRDIEAWHTILWTRGRRGRKGLLDGQGGVSSRTIGHAHRILSKALREGVQHELVLRNVCTVQRPPKVGADKMPILTPAQVAAFPAKLDGHRHAAIAITALFTGMRRGELLATRWGNCDLEAEVIRVRESLEQTRSGLRFKEPKSAAGIRDIRLPAVVTDVLRAHRKQLLETRLVLGQGRLTDQDLVFPAWDGSPQQPNNFCSVWSKLARKLGFDIPFHGLRHTHASQLIHAGVDVVMIARRLGHSSPVITLRVYAHLFPQDDSKAAAAIDAALEK